MTPEPGLSQGVSNDHTPPAFHQGTAYKGRTASRVRRTPSVSSDHPENQETISCECFLSLSRATATSARAHLLVFQAFLKPALFFSVGGVESHALFLSTNTADQ